MNRRAKTTPHGTAAVRDMPAGDPPPPANSRRRWLTALVCVVGVGVSVWLRQPIAQESFWVDELHTAWTIAGDFSDVDPRAAAGNQTAFYFKLLWFWQQCVGGNEPALRLLSTLAGCVTLVVLVRAMVGHTDNVAAGLFVAVVLAFDANTLFFTTEARAYALVMLCVAIVVSCWLRLLREPHRKAACWGLLAMALTAAALHPTAALTLGVWGALPFSMALVGLPLRRASPHARETLRRYGTAGALLIGGALLGLAIGARNVRHVWDVRAQWAAFGVPGGFGDLGRLWPWWLALLPAAGCVGLIGSRRVRAAWGEPSAAPRWTAAWTANLRAAGMLLVVVGAVALVAWGVAASGTLAIWHRRYLIGGWPLLIAAAALLADALGRACWLIVRGRKRAQNGSPIYFQAAANGFLAAAAMVWLAPWPFWQAGQSVRMRSEDWRAAVAFVCDQRDPGDLVAVGAELVESAALPNAQQRQVDRSLIQYLSFPLSGPYEIHDAGVLGPAATHFRSDLARWLSSVDLEVGDRPAVAWWIYRLPEPLVQRAYNAANQGSLAHPRIERTRGNTQAFGMVTVIRFEVAPPSAGR